MLILSTFTVLFLLCMYGHQCTALTGVYDVVKTTLIPKPPLPHIKYICAIVIASDQRSSLKLNFDR